jgi:hypothetical protein
MEQGCTSRQQRPYTIIEQHDGTGVLVVLILYDVLWRKVMLSSSCFSLDVKAQVGNVIEQQATASSLDVFEQCSSQQPAAPVVLEKLKIKRDYSQACK